ncbi:hypothetical protein BJV77DRAFT_964194 [Russula vinacea]|nr:hypothetical protein BJV77DRAFT_964194 [Russula vinacea]
MYVYAPSLLAGWLVQRPYTCGSGRIGGRSCAIRGAFILCSDLQNARLAVAGGTDAATSDRTGGNRGVSSRLGLRNAMVAAAALLFEEKAARPANSGHRNSQLRIAHVKRRRRSHKRLSEVTKKGGHRRWRWMGFNTDSREIELQTAQLNDFSCSSGNRAIESSLSRSSAAVEVVIQDRRLGAWGGVMVSRPVTLSEENTDLERQWRRKFVLVYGRAVGWCQE